MLSRDQVKGSAKRNCPNGGISGFCITTGIKVRNDIRQEFSSAATMDTITRHGIPKTGQPGSNCPEEPDDTNRTKQSMTIITTITEHNVESNGPDPEQGMTSNSIRQEKPDLASSAATRPTQDDDSYDDADTESKLEPSLTTERRNEDDGVDKVNSDSSKSTYDPSGKEGTKGVPNKGDSDKHGAPYRPSSETYGRSCDMKSE